LILQDLDEYFSRSLISYPHPVAESVSDRDYMDSPCKRPRQDHVEVAPLPTAQAQLNQAQLNPRIGQINNVFQQGQINNGGVGSQTPNQVNIIL